uniref:Saposin B-type domain-containing protein n=1 Tax=Strongyloides venezuelensis TaxID=75913 RepID=A0A0K0FGT4_STRVS
MSKCLERLHYVIQVVLVEFQIQEETTKLLICSFPDVLCQEHMGNFPAPYDTEKKNCILCNEEVGFCLIGNTMKQRLKKFFVPPERILKPFLGLHEESCGELGKERHLCRKGRE